MVVPAVDDAVGPVGVMLGSGVAEASGTRLVVGLELPPAVEQAARSGVSKVAIARIAVGSRVADPIRVVSMSSPNAVFECTDAVSGSRLYVGVGKRVTIPAGWRRRRWPH